MVCFSIWIVYIAVRFVRIPARDGMHRFVCHINCTVIWHAQHTNRDSTLGAGTYVSDYNSSDATDA